MSSVEVTRIGYVEMPHEFSEVSERCLYQKMKMVAHEDVTVKPDVIDLNGLAQNFQECLPVFIISEYLSSFIASASYMVYCAGVLYPQRSSHDNL